MPSKRYWILAATVIIQTCLGALHAWSKFVPSLMEEHNLSTAQTQIIFGVTVVALTIATIPAGRLLVRVGSRRLTVISALLFGAGYLVAAFSGGMYWGLLLGIGVLTGSAMGAAFIVTLSTCVPWFPKHKGLVTGIAVAGFGGGAILLSYLVDFLFGLGMDVLRVFLWIGILYGLIILLCALVLELPPREEEEGAEEKIRLGALLKQRVYWALSLGIFAGTFAGLMVIGNLKPIAAVECGCTAKGALAISFLAAGNALGRIVWGWLYDRFGRVTIPASLLLLGLSVFPLLFVYGQEYLLLFLSLAIGFGFGASFVLYLPDVADLYGEGLVSYVYPLIFLSYAVSGATGPAFGGYVRDLTGTYRPAIAFSTAVALLGAIAYWWILGRPSRQELLRGSYCEVE